MRRVARGHWLFATALACAIVVRVLVMLAFRPIMWFGGDSASYLSTALRLTPSGGSVTVTAGPGEITVRDTGPGLEAQDIPRAFERFYLHGRYRSERPVGSGLGLAIVRELVSVR